MNNRSKTVGGDRHHSNKENEFKGEGDDEVTECERQWKVGVGSKSRLERSGNVSLGVPVCRVSCDLQGHHEGFKLPRIGIACLCLSGVEARKTPLKAPGPPAVVSGSRGAGAVGVKMGVATATKNGIQHGAVEG